MEDAGAAAIIYTDIARDGMLSGMNLAQPGALAERLATPVLAPGGPGGHPDPPSLEQGASGARISGGIARRSS